MCKFFMKNIPAVYINLPCRGDSFDLLFSDVVLPGDVNGVDLAQWAVARKPELKVLLTSGYPNDVGTQRGAVEFVLLKKPYTQAELARKVREVL